MIYLSTSIFRPALTTNLRVILTTVPIINYTHSNKWVFNVNKTLAYYFDPKKWKKLYILLFE